MDAFSSESTNSLTQRNRRLREYSGEKKTIATKEKTSRGDEYRIGRINMFD
jgi:hypothetical protein